MKHLNRFIALGSVLTALTALAPATFAQVGGETDSGQMPAAQESPDGQPPQVAPPVNGTGGWQGGGGPGGGARGFGGRQGGPGQEFQGGGGQGFDGSQADREARRAKFMKRFDANGDGTLDASEKAKAQELRDKFGKGGGRRGGGQGFGGQGGPGNVGPGPGQFGPPGGQPGQPEPFSMQGAGGNGGGGGPMENFGGFRGKNRSNVAGDWGNKKQERQQKLMQRFDANGDGTLDANEQAQRDQFVNQMKQRHQERRAQKNAGGTP